MSRRQQNYGIECLRVLLMFGITLLHQLDGYGVGRTFLGRICDFCVVGFVFISGWYGVRFSVSKTIKLYGLGIFAAVTTAFALKQYGDGVVVCAFDFLRYFWFLHAYAVLMCLAPILNLPFEDSVSESIRRNIIMPTIVLVFGYCFISALPILRDWLPRFAGCNTHGFLTLVGIYLAARWVRKIQIEKISAPRCVIVALLASVPCGLGMGKYNSPFAFVMAGSCFLLFYRLNFSASAGRVFAFLGRSMFSVYLLQIGFVGLCLPTRIKELGLSGYPGAFVSAISVFLFSLLIDLLRRVILATGRRFYALKWRC